jgi:phospholipid/cholesterol/gamma-HCH transport system ATP-binding protein
MSAPVLKIAGVRKQYNALRPLRMNDLTIAPGERVALSGLDAGAAEVLVNLVTGASVPDEGDVSVLGRSTASIADGDEWLATLDRFGIVSPRAVLLDAATLRQNLAMPLTLQIDPLPEEAAARAGALAVEAGIDERWLDAPVAGLPAGVRMRAHLVRAVVLDPALLILEHPTATLDKSDAKPFGEVVARMAAARALSTLIISEDADFSDAAVARRLALHAASGDLRPHRRGLFGLFS